MLHLITKFNEKSFLISLLIWIAAAMVTMPVLIGNQIFIPKVVSLCVFVIVVKCGPGDTDSSGNNHRGCLEYLSGV